MNDNALHFPSNLHFFSKSTSANSVFSKLILRDPLLDMMLEHSVATMPLSLPFLVEPIGQ